MAMELFISNDELVALETELAQSQGVRHVNLMLELAWHLRQRDCNRALYLAEQAELQLAFQTLNDTEIARNNGRILLLRAVVKMLLVEFDQAEMMGSAAILQFKSINDFDGVGDCHWFLATLWHDRGSAERIDNYLVSALDNYNQANDLKRIDAVRARILSQEAFSDAALAATKLEHLFPHYQEATDSVQTWILSAKANIAALTDNPGAAIKYDLEAFYTASNSGQNAQALLCTVNASEGFTTLGDLDSAMEWSERGLALARQFNWPGSTGICLMQYGDVLRLLNRFEESSKLLQEACLIMQPLVGSRSYQNMLSRLGQLEQDVGNYQQALEYFSQLEQGLNRQRSADMLIDAWRGQASALAQLGRPEQAIEKAASALELATEKGQVDEQINTLRVFAELHRNFTLPDPPGLTKGTAALHFLCQACSIGESIEGYVIPGELLSQIALEYEKCNDYQLAYINEVAANTARNKMRMEEAQKRALSMQIRAEMDKARAQIEYHIKLSGTLQDTNDTLETLGQIGREITASLDVSAVFETLYRHVDRLLDSVCFMIYLLDEKEHALNMAFGIEAGLPYDPIKFSLNDPTSVAAQCALERREIVVDKNHNTFKIEIIPGTLEVKSMLFSPLEVGKRLLGVMSIQSQQDNAYGERECSIFRTLCAYGAIALDNARAYEEVEAARLQAFRQEQELRIAAIAFNSQEGMFIADVDFKILRINRSFSKITGYEREEVVGSPPTMFKSDRHDKNFYRMITGTLASLDSWQGELWIRHKKGNTFPLWLSITAVRSIDHVVTHFVFSLIDITERKLAEDEIRNLAFYDSLTKLPNRRLLTERLRHALVTSERNGNTGALIFIDLDNFKTINDTRGHDVGDLLLASVSQRLQDCLRQSDTAARLGGDEFVVLLEGLSEEMLEAAELAEIVSEKIQSALNQPYTLQGKLHHSSPSIGVCLFQGSRDSADDLLKQADLAMYQAKAAGRNTIRFFDAKMQEAVNQHAALEMDLRTAMENQHFVLHYQIQVDLSGRVIGAEALIRWQHPERGMVSPAEFIPLAEETGLIVVLGEWILNEACAQLTRWAQDPLTAHLSLAVNISARQFHDNNFVAVVMQAVRGQSANPKRLKLELTESMLVNDVDVVIEKMGQLMNLGVQFSLDDFGTGYSSLSYLKRLPLEQLKIDQSFVRDIFSDANDRAIVHAIVTLGKNLGLSVVAEGVETDQQRQFLEEIGCHMFQGYLFGRPVRAEAMQTGQIMFGK